MANPFTAKAKKAKLKPFGSSAKAKPAVTKKKANGKPTAVTNKFLLAAKKTDPIKRELAQLDERIDDLGNKYEAAMDEEIAIFKKLDKMDLAGKTNSDKYNDTKAAWEGAIKNVDRYYGAFLGLLNRRKNLLNPKPTRKKRR